MAALQGNAWPEKKRIEVATAHVMGLTGPQITVATGVPANTVRQWRMQEWFKDLVEEIQREDDYQADAKLTKIVSKSLDTIVDRLENGDFTYDYKEKQFVRKPLSTRDVVKMADIMFDKRNLLRGKPTTISGKEQVGDRLLKLAEEFARFAQAKTIQAEVINAVQEPSPAEVYVCETSGYSETLDGGVSESGEVAPEGSSPQGAQARITDALHDQRQEGLQEGVQGVRGIEGGDTQAGPSEPSTPGT